MKKHARVKLHPYAHPIPHSRRRSYFTCGSDGGRNQTRQISAESVSGISEVAENDPPPLTWRIARTVHCATL